MKTGHDLASTIALKLQQQPTTTTGQPTSEQEFTPQEVDSTAYFFMRLRNIYTSKYDQHYPTEKDVKMAKREWAHEIGRYSRDQIDMMFAAVKRHMISGDSDFEWPEIGRIIGLLEQDREWRAFEARARETAAHIAAERLRLEDKGAQERARAAGAEALAKIKGMIGAGNKNQQEANAHDLRKCV